MWTTTRLTFYIVTFLGLLAAALAAMGWGTYDAEARTFDLNPIQIEAVAVAIAAVIAPGLAAVATWLGWGVR